jgi:hypothetical protein
LADQEFLKRQSRTVLPSAGKIQGGPYLEPHSRADRRRLRGAVEYRELSRGQIQVEPKEDARKRGVQSPDRAEAEVLAFSRVAPREQRVAFGGINQISPV